MADKPDSGAVVTLNNNLAGATVHLMVSGVEVGGGVGYSSQPWGSIVIVADTASNQAILTFGTSISSWGSVNSVQIRKGGIVVYSKSITPIPVAPSRIVEFPIGFLTVQETLIEGIVPFYEFNLSMWVRDDGQLLWNQLCS